MTSAILDHGGLQSVDFAPLTRSVLVRFDPHAISEEEIMLRIALHLSLDYETAPVRLLAEPEQHFTRLNGSKLWHCALLEFWLQTNLSS